MSANQGADDLNNRGGPTVKPTGVRTVAVGEETLVLDEQSGLIHQLNATASLVWRECDGKTSIEEIAALLIREYDVDPAVAAKDVESVVRQLRELNLLHP